MDNYIFIKSNYERVSNMFAKRAFSLILILVLISMTFTCYANATDYLPDNSFDGNEVPGNILKYLEYCEVDINVDSVIEVTTESLVRSPEGTSSLHITTPKNDCIEETFLSYYEEVDSALVKKNIGAQLLAKTRDGTTQDFYTSGVNVKLTSVYTRTIQGKNYINLTGIYFVIYKNGSSPTINKIDTYTYVTGDQYNVSSGKYTFEKSNGYYITRCNKSSPSYNVMYSENSSMPSNKAIVPVNALGGFTMGFDLYLNGSSNPTWDVFQISAGW